MKTNSPRISPEDKQALKEKHRLELLMQESGERFSADRMNKNIWRSLTTPGLSVDISRQRFEITAPGLQTESGDIFTWLRWRYGWTFPQALRFLQNRPPDPKQEVQPAEMEPEQETKAITYGENAQPIDWRQERALEIAGDRIRKLFSWKSDDLHILRNSMPLHFKPVQAVDIEVCDECESPIDWFWKRSPQYEYQETFVSGVEAKTFKRKRIIPEPQIYAFEYQEADGETFYVCEKCKQDMLFLQEALRLLWFSAYRRENDLAPETERAQGGSDDAPGV